VSAPPPGGSGDGDRAPTVLFLDNSSTFGGAIVSLGHLVGELARRRVRPIVVSGQPDRTLRKTFPEAQTYSADIRTPRRHPTWLLRTVRQSPPRSEVLERFGLRLAAADWHCRRTLPAALRYTHLGRRHAVDLVHLNNIVEAQLDGLLAAMMLRVPCVAHARGFQSPGVLARLAARKVDRHIAISTAIARNLEEIGAETTAVTVIPDGIDVEEFSASPDSEGIRESLGIPAGTPAFGLFGRIMEWKGTREFVSAAAEVLRAMPRARALVVGGVSDGDQTYFEHVRRLAERTGVGDRILFTGYREDTAALMQAMDLVVHCSIEPEPFGMVIIEAMAAGTPVIAANRGGPRDIVRDGETGLLVDPTDEETLASAIRSLLQNPDRARALAEAGRDRARRMYGSERYAERVMEVYADVLSGTGGED